MLSREVQNLSLKYEAHAALVGTYTVGADTVFVTAKLVNVISNTIVTSIDFNITLDGNVKKMLESS